MAKSDDILKKYGITQVRGTAKSDSSSGTNSSKQKSTGITKADSILAKYGIIPETDSGSSKQKGSTIAGYNDNDAISGWQKFLADQKKKREEREEKSWFEKALAMFAQTSDSTLPGANITNVTSSYREDTTYREPADNWSISQKNDFGYLYNQSPEQAWKYAEELNNSLAKAEKEKQEAAVKSSATDGFWKGAAHTAGAIATAPLGLADYLDNMAEFNARGKITEKAGMTPFDYSQTVTGSISQDLNEKHGTLDEDIPVIGGKGWGDVYGLGTSVAQSALAGYTGGQFGTLVQFFGSAAAAGVDEAKQRGASDSQALMMGTLSGTAEGLAEMIGVDNLLNIGSASTMRGLLTNLVKQGAAEGLEEGVTTLMNNFADQIVMQDKSNFNLMVQELVRQGMPIEEAKKKAWLTMANDLAFDMVAGFVSGTVHAGPQTAIQTINENVYQPYQTGKAILESEGNMDALRQLANDVAGVSSADMHQAIEDQIGKVDEKQSAVHVGKLYNTVQSANNLANASANQADIAKSLERKGFDTQKAKAVSEALVARYNGQELTKAQEKTLASVKGNTAVQDAISNIMTNTKSTMGQRSENIRSFQRDVAIGRVAKAHGISADEVRNIAKGNLTTVNENGSESHYEVSVDGKTIDRDGNIVAIKGISSLENGRMVLETETGTIDAGEVSYGSKGEALVYEAVANLNGIIDTNTANKLSKHLLKLGNVSSDVYAKAIQQAYTYGYYGYGRDAMMGENTLSATLTEKQRNVAYGLGEQYRAARTAADQALVRETRTNKKSPASGKVHFDGDRNALTERQSASLSAMETVAEALGVQIHVFESEVGANGKRIGANGWYDPKDNSIHIDLHAGATGEGTMLFTLAHELTHHIRKWSPAKFKILADFLMEEYGKQGVNVDGLVREQMAKAKRAGREISYDTAYEEVIADSMETMLSDGSVVEKLAKLKQVDESLWKKIKDFISELAAKIRKVYEGMSPDSVEGRYVADMVDSIEKLQEMFTEALVDASENYQMAEKNTTEDGGVDREAAIKRSDRIVDQIRISLPQIMALDSVYTIDASNATPYTTDWKTDEQSGHAVFKAQGGVANRPGFGRVVLGKKGVVSTVFHGNGPAKQAAFPAIKSVIEQGIEIGRDYNHNGKGFDTVTFAAPVNFFGTKAPLGVVVKVSINGRGDKSFYIHEICDAEGNYIELVDGVPTKKEISNTGLVDPTSTASAADDGISPKTSIRNESENVKNESLEALDVAVDSDTESVAPSLLFSERTWTESDYVQEREKAAKEIANAIGVSVKKAKAYIDSVNSIAKMIAEDRVRLDYFSSPGRSSFVGNVEYGGSFDFSTLCKKRRLLTGTFTAIQKALPNTALTADEILDIRNRMKDKGLEVSCGLCYVEGSRANMGQFAKEFLKLYKQYYPDAWQPNMADVNTPDGIEWVRINHPECYEQYEYFWNHYGTLKPGDKNLFASQQKPKLYQLHTEYKGEILQKFKDDDNVEEKNLNGGIRLQSFSDFEIVHLIDTMQIIMDMSRVGLAGQAYTKVPDFAWALGDTGLKINLSLIAKGVDENGKLIFDDVEGMPIDTAVALRNRYSKNVGTILVAFNDEQLLAAMADERVDFIIPFHRSQWKKSQYAAMGLPAKTKDYTYMQNEKFIKPQYHEYRGRMVKDKAVNFMPNEYWDFSKSGKENAVAYLEMCARNNKRPKFYKLLQNNGDGSYSLKADGSTDGYWKLLIDFKMYDNEGHGSPQMPVKPNFNMEEATRMLNDYQGGHSNFPVAQGIVDEFVKEYKDSHKGVKYSDRDSDGNQLSTEQQEFFKDSKVRDADGNLMVMYHGTASGGAFTVFDGDKLGNSPRTTQVGQGFYFTNMKKEAESYTANVDIYGRSSKGKNPHLHQVYLNITNPFDVVEDTLNLDDVKAVYSDGTEGYFFTNWIPFYLNRKSVNGEVLTKTAVQAMSKEEKVSLYVDYLAQFGTKELLSNMVRAFPDGKQGELLASMKKRLGYDGIVEEYKPGQYQYVAFSAEQVKATDNQNPTSNPDIRYSDRDTESVSNRSLLANALEGVAQNDIERQRLQEYKGKIDLINAEERKLTELNEKIKELSFSKGPRDTKAIRDLQFEANQTANRISTYDKQLLRLEASKPLQDVLTREKKMAYQRAEKKGKEALAAYREKATKTQRELMDRWQESRKKGIENREKTAMRHKIQNVVGELNNLLLNGDKKRHVPENLKKAVADALALVNMDTVGAEERAAKYAALIAKETDPDKIDAYTVTMENILRQGEKMGQRLKELREAYEEIQESDDPEIANAYDPVIAGCMKELSQSIGNTSLRNMTIEQLSDVYDMYRMVLTRVRDANKSFLNEKKESISNLASRVVGEVRRVGGEHKYRAAILDSVMKFGWNNLKPVYAFEHIGSTTLTEAFNGVRSGEDVWAKDVTEAREYYLDKVKKYGYDSWDFKKKYRFQSASDLEFELTLEQILSLYAYSKREQAGEHLRLGGFVFDSNIETYKDKDGKGLKYKVNTADAHQITTEILAEITGKLTQEQAAFVDEMQEYLSTVMGAKGNEVTMKMYGVKLFKEKFYFPLKSARQFMFEQNEVSGEVKIKNSGFTNKTVAKANNPVILSNFMDVWSGHVNDMSMYHAFVLPLEDFNRIFNYNSPKKENQPSVSVKGTIQNAYGPSAMAYVKQLITDLNGGARTDSTTGVINKMMGLFKKGSVFASLSVVVQQPSAIARAAAIVDTKYFIGPKVDHKRHKLLWNEVKQYAPVAIIKEMGYFDTNMGKSTQDFILGKEYSSFKEKMKALVTDSDFRDEVLSKAPALADEMAWCSIWEAVKRETKAKHPGLDVKGEPFLKLAGSRFTEVITKTQVYDSVLSRSANMRSKDTGMKMATAFMAEPTTSINMIADALLQGKRGNKKYCRAAIGAVIASQILNSILVSFVYAGRDDDEDETYWEKYIGTLSGEILDSMNPAGYIPFIKDIVSIVQGYDVERSDMAVVSDLWSAYQKLSSDKISVYRKVEGFAGSIAQIFGLPLKNIMRDVRGIYQTIDSFMSGPKTTKAGVGYAVKGAITGKTVSDDQQLYESMLRGDTAHTARVKSRFKDQSAISSAIRMALRENDPRIREAAIAWNANDLDEYMRIARSIIGEKHFSQDDVVMAIRAEASKLAPDSGETTSTAKSKGLFTTEKFAKAISQNDQAMAYSIMMDIVQTNQRNGSTAKDAKKSFGSSASSACKKLFLAGGMTADQAENALVDYCGVEREAAQKRVGEWEFEYDYGYSYDDRVEAYKKGAISAYEMKPILMEVGGRTSQEADDDIRAYEWMKSNPSYDISVSDVLAYTKTIEDAGVSVEESGIDPDMFVEYRVLRSKCKGVDEDKDGTADRNSVKNEVLEIINDMPITSYQKDVLYFLNGWAKSTLRKAPWH